MFTFWSGEKVIRYGNEETLVIFSKYYYLYFMKRNESNMQNVSILKLIFKFKTRSRKYIKLGFSDRAQVRPLVRKRVTMRTEESGSK